MTTKLVRGQHIYCWITQAQLSKLLKAVKSKRGRWSKVEIDEIIVEEKIFDADEIRAMRSSHFRILRHRKKPAISNYSVFSVTLKYHAK